MSWDNADYVGQIYNNFADFGGIFNVGNYDISFFLFAVSGPDIGHPKVIP